MKVIIQTPDFTATAALLEFVESNVEKLSQLSDKVLECRVFLKLDKSATKENKICDLKLVIPGQDLFASRQSGAFEDATMQAIEAIKHQMERWKASQKNRRSRESIDTVEPN
jgi:putative sigma-54 modulation protein